MKIYLEILNVGFNNIVFKKRIVAIVGADAAPVRRLKDQARKENNLVDATNGKKTKAVIIMDSGHVVLSSLAPETLALRIQGSVNPLKRK